MNRSLNLPQIQRIMNEFEKESATMDMKEELMSDAVDDAMEDEEEGEGEEAEGDKILKEVLDEIGMNMNDAVSASNDEANGQLASAPTANPMSNEPLQNSRVAVAEGGPAAGGPSAPTPPPGGGTREEDELQRRLDMLRKD